MGSRERHGKDEESGSVGGREAGEEGAVEGDARTEGCGDAVGERVLAGSGERGWRRRGWGWCGGMRHAKVTKDRAQSRGGVTGFHETWEEGEGDGIAQCTRCSYMRSPEDIWLRYNASMCAHGGSGTDTM